MMTSAMSYFAFIYFIVVLYPTIPYALATTQNVDKTFHIGYISGNRNKTTGKFEVFLPGLKIRYTRILLDNRLKAFILFKVIFTKYFSILFYFFPLISAAMNLAVDRINQENYFGNGAKLR